jgi:hypothetical protein
VTQLVRKERRTKLEVFLWTNEKSSYALRQVMGHDKVFAESVVLANEEAKKFHQVREHGRLLYCEIHTGLML